MAVKNFELISNTIDNGVIIIDKELKVHFWNKWLETRTNINYSKIVSKNIKEFFPNINDKKLKRKISTALTLNSPTFYHTDVNRFLLDIELTKVTNKKFEYMQQAVTITPYDRDNELVIIYIYDNTLLCEANYELQKTKNDLEESLKEINLLLNTAMEAIFLFANEQCVDSNDIALKLFKYEEKEEILGKEIYEFLNPNFLSDLNHIKEKACETFMLKKDHQTFPALIKIKDTIINSKKFKILTVVDLSELKEKDKLLVEQTKMAALGEMMGNIAHQWRQPLSAISSAASGIKIHKEFDILTDQIFDEAVDAIVRSSKHLSQTIDDFRDFLKDEKEKINFNLKDNLKKNLLILEGTLKNESIEIVLTCDEKIVLFNYPNELTQAFLNLINNSKDAFLMNSIDKEERVIVINIYAKGSNVYIDVTDNAGGIHDDILKKVFEPYFTTKHKNIGTGLGLYMTHQLVEYSMKGKIEVTNKTFKHKQKIYTGASFLISLPY